MRRKLCALFLAMLFASASALSAAITMQKLAHGTTTPVLSLSALPNGSLSAGGTVFDPRIGSAAFLGYLKVYVECRLTYSTAPTAGTAISVWFLKSPDGVATFENGDTARLPDVNCPVRPATSQTVVGFIRELEPFPFQAIALNAGTGQTLTTGTVSVRPFTLQGN